MTRSPLQGVPSHYMYMSQERIKTKILSAEQYLDQAIEVVVSWAPRLLGALIVLIIGFWVIRQIMKVVKAIMDKRDFEPTVEIFLLQLLNWALKLILIVIVINQLGVVTTSLVAIFGAASLAIGLALQGSLSNFAGGVLIMIFKPFKVGDFIGAQGVEGTVKEIDVISTKLLTFGNQLAVVPNGKLFNENIINYTTEPTRRAKLDIGISYGSNIKDARDVLMYQIKNDPRILEEPVPQVVVGSLGDSSVNMSVRFWAPTVDYWPIYFDYVENAKIALDQAGIEIPFPQRVLHMANGKTDKPNPLPQRPTDQPGTEVPPAE